MNKFSLNEILRALNVSKNTYYYWKKNHNKKTNSKTKFYQEILSIYYENTRIYGAPRIALDMNKETKRTSTSKVSRAMRFLGIKSIASAKFPYRKSTMTEEEKSKIVNLIKGLEVTRINQVWTMDITYIKIKKKTCYLISFIDKYSRKVVSWDICDNQKTEAIIKVLKKAIEIRKPTPGLIIHSDKGSQMRSKMYREYAKRKNIVLSYTSINHSCDENAMQESFHASLKKECIYQRELVGKEETKEILKEYIDRYYNEKRIHTGIDNMSPTNYEKKKNPQ